MPEPPDFDQIARDILRDDYSDGDVAAVTAQLRLVWNARGAADIAEADRHDEHPAQLVVQAIRRLDR